MLAKVKSLVLACQMLDFELTGGVTVKQSNNLDFEYPFTGKKLQKVK